MIDDFGSPTLQNIQFDDSGHLRQNANGRQSVRFFKRRVLEFRAKTDKDGNPVLDPKTGKPAIDPKTGLPFKEAFEVEKLMVSIKTPGDKNEIEEVATPYHKRQFFKQYEFFRKGGGIPDGQRISDCDFIPAAIVPDLYHFGIYTLEQLATCSQMVCEEIPAVWELRDFAKEWLRVNSPQGHLATNIQLRTENAKLEAEVERLSSLVGPDGKPMKAQTPLHKEEVDLSAPPLEDRIMELTPEQFAMGAKNLPRPRGRPKKESKIIEGTEE